MKNYMSAKFASSKEIAAYCLENYRRLWDDTELFVRAFESQTLPDEIKEAVQASFAVLKSTVCVRLADGTLWGWEGVTEKSGSCEGSCTHVWNYAQLAAFLFPELERSMREAEYRYSVDGDGKMTANSEDIFGWSGREFKYLPSLYSSGVSLIREDPENGGYVMNPRTRA